LFKIKLIKNFHINSGWIAKGTVLVARKRPGSFLGINSPYQVIEGPHAGEEIPVEYAVVLPAERMYSESEYNKLRDELIERREEVAALREEKRMLQEEINQLVAEKKVSLPREVAEAIEYFREPPLFSNFDIIELATRKEQPGDNRHTLALINYARNNIDNFVMALVNGYTVEQTLQERIRQGVQKIYEQWTQIPSTGDDQADGADLAERITKFVAAELKL
jgi:hypothetical protein